MQTLERAQFAPPKRLLYGPGPSMVEPRALEAMSQPALGIRDPYFLELISEIRAGLREAFGTGSPATFVVPASGSGGMEAAVANFVYPGSKFAVFTAGVFSERISEMGRRQGAQVVCLDRPWGEVTSAADAEAFIGREKPDVVAFVQAETSTGAYQSGRAIIPAAKNAGALVLADAVTSIGAMPVQMDSIGIDVAFGCTQKGLSCPAGLAPISISPAAWERLSARPDQPHTWYLDLRLMAKYFEQPHVYHHTPSPPLYYALHQSLASIKEEGFPNRWERHRRASERLMRGLLRLGFKPLVEDAGNRVWHLAIVMPPNGTDEAKLREKLLDDYEIEVAGGLGRLAGKVLRMGTMGPLATDENVDFLLQAISACV